MEQLLEGDAVEQSAPVLKLRKLEIRDLGIEATDELMDHKGRSATGYGETAGCGCCC
jgi:hypothetical protein